MPQLISATIRHAAFPKPVAEIFQLSHQLKIMKTLLATSMSDAVIIGDAEKNAETPLFKTPYAAIP